MLRLLVVPGRCVRGCVCVRQRWAGCQCECFMAPQEEVMIGHGHAAQHRSFLCSPGTHLFTINTHWDQYSNNKTSDSCLCLPGSQVTVQSGPSGSHSSFPWQQSTGFSFIGDLPARNLMIIYVVKGATFLQKTEFLLQKQFAGANKTFRCTLKVHYVTFR